MNGLSTIMLDLVPGQGSAVTACVSVLGSPFQSLFIHSAQNNLFRCLLSAVLVSVIELIFGAISVGWTYVLLAGIALFSLPFVYIEIKFGPRIRKKRLSVQTKS